MQARTPSKSPTRLEPPRRSLEDPGAHDLESSENEDDHFSDASEGRESRPASPSTRLAGKYKAVRHSAGHDRGNHSTLAPQEQESGALGAKIGRPSQGESDEHVSSSPQEPVVPTTVVEKVDPFTASYGEVPGTAAYDMRRADAEPDVVVASDEADGAPQGKKTVPPNLPVPITKVTTIDSSPGHGDIPGTEAHEKHKGDAEPDVVEHQVDPQEATSAIGTSFHDSSILRRNLQNNGTEVVAETALKDDFDDFEEGGEDEDFGDFDDGFPVDEPVKSGGDLIEETVLDPSWSLFATKVPLLDYKTLAEPNEIIAATSKAINEIFPRDREAQSASPGEVPGGDSIFITERSHSLWSQLVAAPPLQPPNWVRSRIRRLFLVSLGIPVDLDEILPASKQKKLVLPSLHKDVGPGPFSSPPAAETVSSEALGDKGKESSASSEFRQPFSEERGRKGPLPPPDLDVNTARLVCTTTDAALSNLTIEDLQAHVQKVEGLSQRASEVLEYWLKRKDSARGDKEAFEGVIENLVKHARRVRK